MDASFWVPLIMRWLHIVSAIAAVGSILFYWFAVKPAVHAEFVDDAQRQAFLDRIAKRWRLLVHPPILLFLVSGFYNYIMVTRHVHEGQPLYHALFGIKFLLAILVFALAVIATSSRPWSEKVRSRPIVLVALVLLSLSVVMIGGYMRVMPQSESDVETAIKEVVGREPDSR